MKSWNKGLTFGLISTAFVIGITGNLFGKGYTPQLISLLILIFLSFFVLLSEIIFKKPLVILDFLQTFLLLLVAVILFVIPPELGDAKETLYIYFLLLIIAGLITSLITFYVNINHELTKLTRVKKSNSID